jgi:hypothetical protein
MPNGDRPRCGHGVTSDTKMRYIVCFLLLPLLPASAFAFPSSLPIDRLFWGVLVAFLAGAVSARYARSEGGSRGTAAAYGITTAVLLRSCVPSTAIQGTRSFGTEAVVNCYADERT